MGETLRGTGWVGYDPKINPNGLHPDGNAHAFCAKDATPLGLCMFFRIPQGRHSCVAPTLG